MNIMHDKKTCNERVTLFTKMRVSMTRNCNRNSGAHVQGGWRLDSKSLSLPHYLAQSALLFARVSTSLWVHGSLQSCWSMSLSISISFAWLSFWGEPERAPHGQFNEKFVCLSVCRRTFPLNWNHFGN